MRFVLLFVSVVLAATLSAPAAAQPGSRGTPDPGIVKVADAYVKAALARDAKAIAALYTEDAIEMPPNEPAIKGRAAIEQYYTKMFADPGMKMSAFTVSHIEATAAGKVGYDVGTYRQTMSHSGKPMEDTGKYTVIVKRAGNDWKVAYAIYNSDKPPMMPPSGQKPSN